MFSRFLVEPESIWEHVTYIQDNFYDIPCSKERHIEHVSLIYLNVLPIVLRTMNDSLLNNGDENMQIPVELVSASTGAGYLRWLMTGSVFMSDRRLDLCFLKNQQHIGEQLPDWLWQCPEFVFHCFRKKTAIG